VEAPAGWLGLTGLQVAVFADSTGRAESELLPTVAETNQLHSARELLITGNASLSV